MVYRPAPSLRESYVPFLIIKIIMQETRPLQIPIHQINYERKGDPLGHSSRTDRLFLGESSLSAAIRSGFSSQVRSMVLLSSIYLVYFGSGRLRVACTWRQSSTMSAW
jgi:hypothetical protein